MTLGICDEPMVCQVEGSLLKSRAFWVSESIIAWNVDAGDDSCYLFASKTAALSLTGDGVSGIVLLSLASELCLCLNVKVRVNVGCVMTGEDVKVDLREDRHGLPQNVGSILNLFVICFGPTAD